MKDSKNVFQVLTYGRYGEIECYCWFYSKGDADNKLIECKELFENSEFWIEEGTEHIIHKCRGCEDIEADERHDAYGITTGYWCDDCYENNYPYKKYRYDYEAYGERLDEDY